MRFIVLTVLAVLFGYGVLQIERIDPDNYVKMYLGNYVVEVKVLGLLLLLMGIVLILYFLVWLIRFIWRSPLVFSNWQQRRHRDKSDEQLGAGYLSLIKGDWSRAEKQLTNEANYSHVPYLNFLAAARAAQEQGRYTQRDDYLTQAYTAAPKERLAIGLTKARLHQKAGQLGQAQATLEDIRELGQKNPQYTAMLIQTHQQANNWRAIQQLLPAAKKQKALPSELLNELQSEIYLDSLTSSKDVSTAWKALPRAERKRSTNVLIYAQHLADSGDTVGTEKLIRSSLKHDWNDGLVDLYGQLQSDKPEKLLRRTEGWIMARPENAHLSLAAGRLAMSSGFYDEAKKHLQAAITNGLLPAAYTVLGQVFEANGESSKALQTYRTGVELLESKALTDQKTLTASPTTNTGEGELQRNSPGQVVAKDS